mgnify:CR=1 FL=1
MVSEKKNKDFNILKVDNEQVISKQITSLNKLKRERDTNAVNDALNRLTKESKNKNSGSPLTPEALELSSNFILNKGKLPWPLEKGLIISRFGVQKNKVISGVQTKNNGIDFSTESGQKCRVIFDGTISRIY